MIWSRSISGSAFPNYGYYGYYLTFKSHLKASLKLSYNESQSENSSNPLIFNFFQFIHTFTLILGSCNSACSYHSYFFHNLSFEFHETLSGHQIFILVCMGHNVQHFKIFSLHSIPHFLFHMHFDINATIETKMFFAQLAYQRQEGRPITS